MGILLKLSEPPRFLFRKMGASPILNKIQHDSHRAPGSALVKQEPLFVPYTRVSGQELGRG